MLALEQAQFLNVNVHPRKTEVTFVHERAVFVAVTRIDVRQGRHPVVERSLDGFVPNDLTLESHDQQLLLLTGPKLPLTLAVP